MEALDAAPDVAVLAHAAGPVTHRDGRRIVEAESATLTGGARVVRPGSPWTGESRSSGGAYVTAPGGARLTWTVPSGTQPRLVEPIAGLRPDSAARAAFTSGDAALGQVRFGAVGEQGIASAPVELLPIGLPGDLPAGATGLSADVSGGAGDLDGVLLTPLVSELVTGRDGHAVALLSSVARTPRTGTVTVPGDGLMRVTAYDTKGRVYGDGTADGRTAKVTVPPGGFALVTR